MSDEIKLVSLDNIKIVKSYIDKVRGELSSQIDSVTEHYLNEQLDDAKNAILNAYEEDSKELRDRIAYVEAFGQEYEGQLQELKLQQDTLQGDFEHKNIALDALQTKLDILSGNYDALYNDITSGAIFNSGELNNIIKTAMIDEVRVTENTVLTPEMYASKVVALIANFGSVKASNIESGVIAGSTIKSTNNIAGTNKPVWIIDNDGSGYLAKENIKWTREGDVTFGPDVKLSWSSISDGDSAVQSALNNYDDYIQNTIEDNVKLHTENLADDAAEILSASLIDHTELDGNHIATPSLFAKKIVGAIGTFGTVKADKIVGNTIQGYTISAPNTVIDESGNVVYTDDYEYETDESGNPIVATNSNGTPIVDADGNTQYVIATKLNADGQYVPKKIPAIKDDADISWALKSDGSGWLANHNIEWTNSGTVEFGSDVKLKWDNIDGIPEIPEGFTEEQIKNFATEITNNSLKTLTIDAAQITSGKITADQIDANILTADAIIGDELVGKTIKSSENEWEIQDGGTAKFANNRVCFNADGSGWIGKRDNGMAVLSWKKDGTIDASNTTEYDASTLINGRMGVNPSTLFTGGIYLCDGNVQLEKSGGISNRANLPAGVYTFVNTTGESITLTLPRFNNTTNCGLVITIPAFCGADVRFVYNSAGQFEFIPLVGSTVKETFL